MPTIRWKRSVDGFVESHDGHWQITPNYGTWIKPQSFRLLRDGKVVDYLCATQRDAKAAAIAQITPELTSRSGD